MSLSRTWYVCVRVLQQLRRDPRTIALMLAMPVVLLVLLYYVFDGSEQLFDGIAPMLVGLFPFILMFIVTSVTMLRERTQGTLERLMAMPIAKADLLLGYGLAFGIVAAVQSLIAAGTVLGPLGVSVAGPTWLLIVFTVGNGVLGSSLGLLASAFARTEFQAIQFMPALVLPQFLLCGLLTPRDQMAPVLEKVSVVLPMTWSFEGLQLVAAGQDLGNSDVVRDLVVVYGVTLLSLVAGAATLRRRTA
ncbi:MAG: ABC transporter permease [Thermoleophilia bacterium]|nr:ABC transporter permease [Thermoleophilia bacterium]